MRRDAGRERGRAHDAARYVEVGQASERARGNDDRRRGREDGKTEARAGVGGKVPGDREREREECTRARLLQEPRVGHQRLISCDHDCYTAALDARRSCDRDPTREQVDTMPSLSLRPS